MSDDEMKADNGREEDIESLKVQVAVLAKEKEDYLNQLKRARADYENLYRRISKEGETSKKYGHGPLFVELICILEDMERAIRGSESARAKSAKNLRKGVEMIYRNLRAMLEAKGLKQFEDVGKSFDPMRHEAVMSKPDSDVEEGRILNCVKKGYMLHDKVLIPAKVIVSRKEDVSSKENNSKEERGEE